MFRKFLTTFTFLSSAPLYSHSLHLPLPLPLPPTRLMSTLSPSYTPKKAACLQFHVGSDTATNILTAKKSIYDTCSEHRPSLKLIVLPEVWNSPYATSAFPAYAKLLPAVGDKITGTDDNCEEVKMLAKAAQDNNVFIVGGSMPEKDENGKVYNSCLCFNPQGEVVAKHAKVHLFDISVPGGITFKESDTLTGGNSLLSSFDTGDENFGKVGVGICYDIRFPELSLLLRSAKNVNLLCFPGAFNMVTGSAHWELLQRSRAVDCQSFVLTASPARATESMKDETIKEGKYPVYTAWGHSSIVSPWGTVIATCDEEPSAVVATVDLNEVNNMRRNIPTGVQKRNDLYSLKEVVYLKLRK